MAYLYPYGDTQQLNLDWLIEQWNEVKSQIDGSLQAEIDRVEAAITDLLTARDEAVAAQTAAQTSAQAAAGSASTASGAAGTATAQAQAAAQSAAVAGAHAQDAQNYAATADQYAQAAQNSAGSAATSASQAAAYEANARTSAQQAAGSETNAATSAAGALQNFQLSDAARVAAQDAAQDAQDVLDSIPADYSTLSDDVSDLNSLLIMSAGFPLLMPNKTTLTRYSVTVEKFGNVLKLDADDRTGAFFIGVNGEYCGQNTPSLTELPNGTYKIVVRFKGLLNSNTITGSGIALYCDDVDENNVITNILTPRPQINIQATEQTIIEAYQFIKNNQHNFSFRIQLRAHIVHGLLRVDIIPN